MILSNGCKMALMAYEGIPLPFQNYKNCHTPDPDTNQVSAQSSLTEASVNVHQENTNNGVRFKKKAPAPQRTLKFVCSLLKILWTSQKTL